MLSEIFPISKGRKQELCNKYVPLVHYWETIDRRRNGSFEFFVTIENDQVQNNPTY